MRTASSWNYEQRPRRTYQDGATINRLDTPLLNPLLQRCIQTNRPITPVCDIRLLLNFVY